MKTFWRQVKVTPPFNKPLLLRFANGSFEVGYYLTHIYRDDNFYSYPEPNIEFILEAVTHWKEITPPKF
jgi:hypothetical protein